MEKVIRRAKLFRHNTQRRRAKRDAIKENAEAWQRRQQAQHTRKTLMANITTERRQRQEDWRLGPLAPRRDTGKHTDSYGSVDFIGSLPPNKHPHNRLKWWHLAEGDRVVLLRGRERGKIGVIVRINKENETVAVKGLELMMLRLPDFLRRQGEDLPLAPEVVPRERDIPVEHVRLVDKLLSMDGRPARDVVVERVERVPATTRNGKDQRRLPGTDVIIPWPEKPVDDEGDPNEPSAEPQTDDTHEMFVEENTFRPYMNYDPFPASVIDELRNKYSRFRMRPTFDQKLRLERRDERLRARESLAATAQTPLQQLAALRLKQKELLPRKELTTAQLSVIGEAIARERQARSEAQQAREAKQEAIAS